MSSCISPDVQMNTGGQDLRTYLDVIGKLFILAMIADSKL